MASDPEATQPRVSWLIRNTVPTVISRSMKSCWLFVFACGPEHQALLRQRLD
jgi:hypothetical protein